MILAMEGLRENDTEGYAAEAKRIDAMVKASLELPKPQMEWLLLRVPLQVLNVETLEALANRYLKEKQYLAALMQANAAARWHPDVERVHVLQAEIFAAGMDFSHADAVLKNVNRSRLSKDDLERLTTLSKTVADSIADAANRVTSPTTWTNSKWPIAKAEVLLSSNQTKQAPNRYRLPIEVVTASAAEYRNLRMFFCPWGERKSEFELRNSRGNLIRRTRIRKDDGSSSSFGYTTRCKVDIQNHVAEFSLNKWMYFVDWFDVIAGKSGSLWMSSHAKVSPIRTAFTGNREIVIGAGEWISCQETLTGRLIWKRKMADDATRVVSHGSRVTVWSEPGQTFSTFDVASGRLVRKLKSKRYIVAESQSDKMVMSYPVRKGELPADEEQKLLGSGKPNSPAKIAIRYAVFDASAGRLVWTRIVSAKSKTVYLPNEICNLSPAGKLSFTDIATGEINAEVDLSLSDFEKATMTAVNVRRHHAGWVVHVECKGRTDRFVRGKSSYQFYNLHRELSSGPVFLLDESRTELVWDSPVYLERMEYLNNQPVESPVIMFGRQIERTNSKTGEIHHMQTVLLDPRTGKLVSSNIMQTYENYNGYAMEWTKSDQPTPSTLVISTPTRKLELNFGSDSEMPPEPRAYLTFNAFDFFDDSRFEPVRDEVVDTRIDEFRARAIEAEKLRGESQAKSAAELKRIMGGSGE